MVNLKERQKKDIKIALEQNIAYGHQLLFFTSFCLYFETDEIYTQ